jgi:BolA family transcriptional regulator, general stress-responsive regulator
MSRPRTSGPIQSSIEAALTDAFAPWHLAVLNESHTHSVPEGSESHFKVVIVSDAFDGTRTLGRHRAVHQALKPQLDAGLHALSVQAHTRQDWIDRGGVVPDSPPCHGGSKGS